MQGSFFWATGEKSVQYAGRSANSVGGAEGAAPPDQAGIDNGA
jgi:hypothetical protein